MKQIGVVLKGLFVGATMMVPGISGGSMAMILGIYDRLITSVSSFRKNVRGNLIILILFALGGGCGMLLFARPLSMMIERCPKIMLYFFIGIVGGSLPMIYKKARVERVQARTVLYLAAGIGIVVLLQLLPGGLFQGQQENGIVGYLLLVLAGIIAAIALVLPGISVSYMLLMLGLYEVTIDAVNQYDFPLLIPLFLGLVLGVVVTTKILERLMNEHPGPTYLLILGFMLASVWELFPGIPVGWEWFFCVGSFVAGGGIIRIILRFEGTAEGTAILQCPPVRKIK